MRTRRTSLIGGVVATLAAAGAVVAPVTPVAMGATGETAKTPGYDVADIEWKDCPQGDEERAQCATIEVPLDWSEPDGAKTHIGIARLPATKPDKRIGVLMMNPGGPGSPATLHLASGSAFTDAVNQRFDLVAFDPRGIYTSEQVRCDKELSQQAASAWPPESEAQFDELVSLNKRLMASCRENSGDIVDHVDTADNARDMDAVRAALGEEKLNYLGFSYGTLLGQQYAELFPHRIRAMVNDANLDHSVESTLDFMRGLTRGAERNFLDFAKWCDSTPSCALHGQNTAKVYGELKKKAKAGELERPKAAQPSDFEYLTGQLAIYLDRPQEWKAGAQWLADLRDANTETPALRAPREIGNDRAPLWCSDWRLRIKDYAEYQRLRSTLAREFPNVEWSRQSALFAGCVGEPTPTTNPQRPLDIEDAPPLLMIGNRHDMQTAYEWSETAAEQSGSRLVTYEGAGHTAYGTGVDSPKSPCVNGAVDDYLIDLTLPEEGLSCPAVDKDKPPA